MTFQHRSHDQNTKLRKFKMAVGRHFENSFIAISQPEIIRLQRNLVCRCRLSFQGRLLNKIPKFCKFKMADGRHIENHLTIQWVREITSLDGKLPYQTEDHIRSDKLAAKNSFVFKSQFCRTAAPLSMLLEKTSTIKGVFYSPHAK